jgi:outer membrane biosynthesis protein TonB
MIPRILVPQGARLPDGEITTTRRRPSGLDERTLVPSSLPIITLDGSSTIPSNLPLDAIAARTVVPRDVNIELVQKEEQAYEHSSLPAQPTDMDERVSIPQGIAPPEDLGGHAFASEELVEPDIIQTGEVSFLSPERASQRTLGEKITFVVSAGLNLAFILLLILAPKWFGPHVRSQEEEEIARKQISVLLPPGALESLKPPTPPAPHAPMNVDPRVIRKIAPPAPKVPEPAPQPQPTPVQPKRELPSTPVPNAVAPTPQANAPVSKGDLPKSPTQLETPDMPVPSKGLILPKENSPGGMIRDASQAHGKISAPVAIGGGGQLPGGGSRGGGGHGTAGAGIQLLTDTEGVNFDDYLHRVYITVRQNWYSVMPASVSLGDQGIVSLQFKIMRDGSVPEADPQQVFGSGKEPLDRAAVSSIRASNPFQPLPSQFKGPYIELRFTYYYNTAIPQN